MFRNTITSRLPKNALTALCLLAREAAAQDSSSTGVADQSSGNTSVATYAVIALIGVAIGSICGTYLYCSRNAQRSNPLLADDEESRRIDAIASRRTL